MRSALALSTWVLTFACAGPPPAEPPVAPQPIDLAPRCLSIAEAPPFAEEEPTTNGLSAGSLSPWPDPPPNGGTQPGFALTTPATALESTSWGFRPTAARHPFALRLAAALLRDGSTTDEPEAFRARLRELGASAAVHLEGGWLWLELTHPPEASAAARELLSEWAQPHRAGNETFARTRRSVALVRLAEEASAEHAARLAFERLYTPPPGAERSERADDDESRSWGPDELDAFLRRQLEPNGSIRIRSTAVASDDPAAEHDPTPPSGASALSTDRVRVESTPLDPEPGALYLVDRPGAPQVEILVGHPTVGPGHPDAAPLEGLASLLGGNVGGRLFRDLRERQGLAYIINAFQEPQGRFVVTTRARPERVAALLVGIEAHLRALVDTPLLECEVEDLRRRMAGEEALRADDPLALRRRLRQEVAWFGSPRSSAARAAAMVRLDRQRLESVARRHLSGAPIVVLVGDADGLRPHLAQSLPERRLRVFDTRLDRAD